MTVRNENQETMYFPKCQKTKSKASTNYKKALFLLRKSKNDIRL